jgi:hypothetical protein
MQRTAAIAAALVLGAPLAPAVAAEDTRFGLDAEVTHDTNATRGPGGADSQSDNILSVEGSATRSMLLGPNSGAVFRGAARYVRFTDFSDISNLALVGRAAWRYQRDRSFGAPWYELAGEAQLLRHADSDLRDGSVISLSGSVGRYLTDRVRISGGLSLDKRSGDDTGLYDLSTNRLWGTFDLRLGARNAFYARLTRLAGDHVFNAATGINQGLLSLASDRIIADPALGAGFLGYRTEATTWLYDLGYNMPLQNGHGLDFSLTYYSSKTDVGGYKYDGAQLRATYLYRFQ